MRRQMIATCKRLKTEGPSALAPSGDLPPKAMDGFRRECDALGEPLP
jgi:hypothetical protein